jgi:hypothetical protein
MPKVQKNKTPPRKKKATSIKKKKASKNSINTKHKKRTSTKATTMKQRTKKNPSHKKTPARKSVLHTQAPLVTKKTGNHPCLGLHRITKSIELLTQEFLQQEVRRNTSITTPSYSQQLSIRLHDEKDFLQSLIDLMRPVSSHIDKEELTRINFTLKKFKVLLEGKPIDKITIAKILIMKKYSYFIQTTALKTNPKLVEAITLKILLQVNSFLSVVYQKNQSKISFSKQALKTLINGYFSSYQGLLSKISRNAFLTVLPTALELCSKLPSEGDQFTEKLLSSYLSTVQTSQRTEVPYCDYHNCFFSDKELPFHNLNALVRTYIDVTADEDSLNVHF